MTLSDMLNFFLTIISIVIGVGVSVYFFRHEQVINFHELERTIRTSVDQLTARLVSLELNVTRLSEVTGQVKENTSSDFSRKLDALNEIQSLKGAVDRLSTALDETANSIVAEVRGQQKSIAGIVQDTYASQSRKAAKDILSYLQRDLDKAVPSTRERDELIRKAGVIIEQAIETMGKYQLVILEKEQDNALVVVSKKANQQNTLVKDEVREVRQSAESLERTLMIPEPPQNRNRKK